MSKQVVLQQCDFCRKTAKRVETIEKHEKHCVSNPDGRNCFLCKHQEYGPWDYDRWDGGYDVKDAHFCTYHEVLCDKNMALKCAEFERGQRGF